MKNSIIYIYIRLLREQFFVRAEKLEIKPKEESTDQSAGTSGKEPKSTLRKRGEKLMDSPRPKKVCKEHIKMTRLLCFSQLKLSGHRGLQCMVDKGGNMIQQMEKMLFNYY